jgi:hypothetical protein
LGIFISLDHHDHGIWDGTEIIAGRANLKFSATVISSTAKGARVLVLVLVLVFIQNIQLLLIVARQ